MNRQNWFTPPDHFAFTCYCLDLRPLSVGHLHLLREIDSPYPYGDFHTESDLRLAAFICSKPWSLSKRFIDGKSFWFRRVVWKALTGLLPFDEEHERFLEYLSANLNGIATKTIVAHPGIGVDTVVTPFEWVLLGSLTQRMPYADAMDLSVWRALRLEVAIAERDGKADVVSDELLDLFDLAERETVNGDHNGLASESNPSHQRRPIERSSSVQQN